MSFNRTLTPDFIDALNTEYSKENSWWKHLCENKDYIIAMRNNYLNVYRNGCNIAKITYNLQQKRLESRIHYKFILVKNTIDPYVLCLDGIPKIDNTDRFFIKSINQSDHIKKITELYGGEEKSGVHKIILSNDNIIDTEIALSKKDDCEIHEDSRIDFCAVQDNKKEKKIRFFEAKHYSYKSVLHSSLAKEPKVIKQLNKYENYLTKYKTQIEDSYSHMLEILKNLKGSRILGRNISNHDELKIKLDVKPLLVVFGFDNDHKKSNSSFMFQMNKIKEIIGDRLLLKGSPNEFSNRISK